MKLIGIGTGLAVVGLILSWIIWGAAEIYTIPAGLGALFLVLMIFSSGAMPSGHEAGSNFANESKEMRNERTQITQSSFLLTLPNLLIAGLLYFFIH
ncbi:hypothetical protein JMA_04950 [Jeotgalibacillus malaysiensis]|uniref:Uncharacterized protein n=1 Tax=Jeotgalibacillus malaysiensis TaxID=1508404 RepID=A0A0B5AMD3_9BACL|nr:DUF5316 family protein [Jeotgalibacillus malaysiensis]AJD89812.1 hypothetical protein JMA_04950 [Jeotgalibacillus malaysiensis]